MKTAFILGIVMLASMLTLSVYANVEYTGKDTATQGDWMGKYGENGAIIFDAGAQGQIIDSSESDHLTEGVIASYDVGIAHHYNWANSTNDKRGLQLPPDGASRIAACIFHDNGWTLTLTVDATDYNVAVYFLDWDLNMRIHDVVGYQGKSPPQTFDFTVEAPDFQEGVYHLWHVTGNEPFKLEVAQRSGNVVSSGVFVDGATAAVKPGGKVTTTWAEIKK